MEKKICKSCGVEKPLTEYYLQNNSPIAVCKTCFTDRQKEKRRKKAEAAGKEYKPRFKRTPEEAKILHRQRCNEYLQRLRETETPEEKEARMERAREACRKHRLKKGMKPRNKNKTDDQKRQKRVLTKEQRKRATELANAKRLNETPEERMIRLEKAKEYTREWKKKNPDKVKEARVKQYVKKLQEKGGDKAVFNYMLKEALKGTNLLQK